MIKEKDKGKPKLSRWLVVDTAGFIKNVSFDLFGENIVTLKEVVSEIRDKETKKRLYANPLDIKYMEPNDASINKVIEVAKKTGDNGALSMTDIKVMALALMLEVQEKGSDGHLNMSPETKKTTEYYHPRDNKEPGVVTLTNKMAGFYLSDCQEEEEEADEESGEDNGEPTPVLIEKEELEEEDEVEDEEDEQYISNDDFEEDDEDDGWITPENLAKKKKEMLGTVEDVIMDSVAVACMTSDFAMQNVMIHMGLNVASPTGQLIKETKTWILRCYACFKTTPQMDRKFCPKCGNKTLKRVSVTLNPDGTQQIHISTRRGIPIRGTKFSLPTPKGGKHAHNPQLTEDQMGARQMTTKLARAKTKALEEDFDLIGGNAPFSKRDVTSKSAMMGVGHHRAYWEHRNPNAVGKKTGNRKKKRI